MTQSERRHLNAVAELGCILCARLGTPGTPAEIHHPRKGQGMGQRASHKQAIPLCIEHHRGKTGVHGMGTKAFSAHYGIDEDGLLADVRRALGA